LWSLVALSLPIIGMVVGAILAKGELRKADQIYQVRTSENSLGIDLVNKAD